MARLRVPRLRWWGWAGVAFGVLVLYLVALSVIPAIFGDDAPQADTARARRAITAENWALVLPEDRVELAKAIDDAWRDLRAYRLLYRTGTPAELSAGTPRVTTSSEFNLNPDGHIAAQHDMTNATANAPGSGGMAQRFEGYRILTNQDYVNENGRSIGKAELIYQQNAGVWSCQRVLADKRPESVPGLNLEQSGDGGFSEIDGRRVRGLTLPAGAFGLRAPATVWVDVESLLVRGQEIASAVEGQREAWRYGNFNETNRITPPTGINCVSD